MTNRLSTVTFCRSRPVTIIDYGSGNLHSVVKAFHESGALVRVTSDPDDVRQADRLVLPGVGAFEDGMRGLQARGLAEASRDYIASGRPLLGICLGMQMLLTESEEFGKRAGLGIIPGSVTEIPRRRGFKVPHMGWNRIVVPPAVSTWTGTILQDTSPGTQVYFVHSFTAAPENEADRLADADYGGTRISAAIQRDNVVGCQFHPEKSGPSGLAMIGRFLDL